MYGVAAAALAGEVGVAHVQRETVVETDAAGGERRRHHRPLLPSQVVQKYAQLFASHHTPAMRSREKVQTPVLLGGVVKGGPGAHQIHGKDIAPRGGVLVPPLRRADSFGRLHEELIGVHLDVISAQQVGDDVHHLRIGDVAPHDVVIHRQDYITCEPIKLGFRWVFRSV